MISEWLGIDGSERKKCKNSTVTYLRERSDKNEISINNILENVYNNNFVASSQLQEIAEKYGQKEALNLLISHTNPRLDEMKKGRLGEMIATEVLIEHFNFKVPVKKLRYVITSDQSLPGTDVIGFKTSKEQIEQVCYLEVKLSIKKSSNPAVRAHNQLLRDLEIKFPSMLSFVLKELYDKDKDLHDKLLKFLLEDVKRTD